MYYICAIYRIYGRLISHAIISIPTILGRGEHSRGQETAHMKASTSSTFFFPRIHSYICRKGLVYWPPMMEGQVLVHLIMAAWPIIDTCAFLIHHKILYGHLIGISIYLLPEYANSISGSHQGLGRTGSYSPHTLTGVGHQQSPTFFFVFVPIPIP